MPTVQQVAAHLEELAPLEGAEDWDNVGLLVGDGALPVTRLMTCLTITPTSCAEAVEERADLIVVHHPLPFRPLTNITTETVTGRLLWQLIGAGISVYSAHTAFDSARDGINEQWAAGLDLQSVDVLIPPAGNCGGGERGAGRWGVLSKPENLAGLARRVKKLLSVDGLRVVGDDSRTVRRVAVACGSGGSFLDAACERGCDCLVTGEATFHTCLEAEASDMALILCGHFASERFGMERLAGVLTGAFPDVHVWASRRECDPIRTIA